MNKKNKRWSSTLAIQLMSLCSGREDLVRKAEIVEKELYKVMEVDDTISNQPQLMLNKVLHATRAMDTGMRTFLDLFDAVPEGNKAMGPYLTELKKGKVGCFGRLNGDLAERIKNDVVNERNHFLHTAGEYPTRKQADKMLGDVLSYLQTILNLA